MSREKMKQRRDRWQQSLSRLRSAIVRSRRGAFVAVLSSLRSRDGQSLVSHIQLVQLALGLLVYFLAVGGVWWISDRVSQDYFEKQAAAWLDKLDQLGTPLYISSGASPSPGIEKQIGEFPEIIFVRYYGADGSNVLAEYNINPLIAEEIPPLGRQQLETLRALRGPDEQRLLERTTPSRFVIRASAPVWTSAIQSDGLFGFDPEAQSKERKELIGFVEVGLDFRQYRGQLIKNIVLGTVVITLLLWLSLWTVGKIVKRALLPLQDLQKPLARLAAGDTDVKVHSRGHTEIIAISDALKTTINALKERDETLRRLADHDQLTGLLNRHRFAQLLDHEATKIGWGGGSSALLFLDMDQFKLVNDSVGHAAGDRLLVQVASRLKASLRKGDTLCRFGGDEFAILARGVSREGVTPIAESLIRILKDMHFVEKGQMFNICCSIGVTIIDSDGFTPDELIAQADMACYEAKSRGRNCFSLFAGDSGDTEQLMAYIGFSQRLKDAISNDNFLLNYQPIVNMENGQAELFEVLLRMWDDGDAIRLPSRFLPVAERFGLMLDIDRWVIRNATKALAKFREGGVDVKFCVNLSGHAFEDSQLVTYVADNLEANSLPADCLVFEITEQTAIRYLDDANERMHELIRMGCRFALDDFGAGFSSLAYMKRLPVDYIKIEGSFIVNLSKDPIDQAMVKSIIEIARTTGKRTIAEYVQDAKSLHMLRKFGVDYVQGFYVGKPAQTLVLPGSQRVTRLRARR